MEREGAPSIRVWDERDGVTREYTLREDETPNRVIMGRFGRDPVDGWRLSRTGPRVAALPLPPDEPIRLATPEMEDFVLLNPASDRSWKEVPLRQIPVSIKYGGTELPTGGIIWIPYERTDGPEEIYLSARAALAAAAPPDASGPLHFVAMGHLVCYVCSGAESVKRAEIRTWPHYECVYAVPCRGHH